MSRPVEATEDVWEYQRKGAFGDYGAEKLLASDPRPFVDVRTLQPHASLDSVKLPSGQGQGDWAWEADWVPSAWEYAWNATASHWKKTDGAGIWLRRRRWKRLRRLHSGLQPAALQTSLEVPVPLKALPVVKPEGNLELVDLTRLRLLYRCDAKRNRRDIANMVQVVICSYTSPNAFFASWSKCFAASKGRSQELVSEGALFIIYDLEDEEVLFSLLLPIITESGEYRNEATCVEDLAARFARFAIVLPGWKGGDVFTIPKLIVEHRAMPAFRMSFHNLE